MPDTNAVKIISELSLALIVNPDIDLCYFIEIIASLDLKQCSNENLKSLAIDLMNLGSRKWIHNFKIINEQFTNVIIFYYAC